MTELKIVNEFPKGIKRFDVSRYQAQFKAIFHRHFHVASKYITNNTPRSSDAYNIGWGYNNVGHNMTPESMDDYPIFKVESVAVLTNMGYYLNDKVYHHKDAYQSSRRIEGLCNIPIISNEPMRLQYDPENAELLWHDCPYEGPLVKSKNFSAVNKAIITRIKELPDEFKMFKLIAADKDGNVSFPDTVKCNVSDSIAEDMPRAFTNVVDGSATIEDYVTMCVGLRQYKNRYSYNSHSYVMAPTGVSYKWYPGAKAQVYYKFGAYELPDDYEKWFDIVAKKTV